MKERASSITAKAGLLLGLIVTTFVAGCVVEPNEGYYDGEHHRYYHDHTWVSCDRDGDDCRTHHDHDRD